MIKKSLIILVTSLILGIFIYQLSDLINTPKEFRLQKMFDQCCCDFQIIKSINQRIYERLEQLKETYFFQIYRVNTDVSCPFWAAHKICTNNKCSLCQCQEDEIPKSWKKKDLIVKDEEIQMKGYSEWCNNFNIHQKNQQIKEEEDSNAIFINLEKNPESNTGYQGRNIWPVIYMENCFLNKKNLCTEEIMFNKIISGFQGSITSHISEFFSSSEQGGQSFPNVPFYFAKLGDFQERLENIYFTFSFLLRAINIASEQIHKFEINTGREEDDHNAVQLLKEIMNITRGSCYTPIREHEYFQDLTKKQVKNQIFKNIQNISKIIDCVECEKCKVHAKLQIQGIHTALRILFSDNKEREFNSIKRNDFIALINTVIKQSRSLMIIDRMFERRYQEKLRKIQKIFQSYFLIIMGIFIVYKFLIKRNKESKFQQQEYVKNAKN